MKTPKPRCRNPTIVKASDDFREHFFHRPSPGFFGGGGGVIDYEPARSLSSPWQVFMPFGRLHPIEKL